MACNCQHNRESINDGKEVIAILRELFIKRMTVDSDHNDRRRKDYNQAIFHYEDDDQVEFWNKDCEKYGLPKKKYGQTYPVWSEIDMDMVLRCFDDAAKDWRKTWCDVENCTRKE
ncbi:MAG: hypothetical protein IJA34_00845 [Lachnospiraceae bacterium]|nr:hypothetical protein [Lachnospiraceae bacterium]